MKKFMFCFLIFAHANISPIYANTISMDFLNEDGSVYDTTTCNIGDDIELPTPPTKRGYTFQGWQTITQIEYLESTGSQYIDTKTKVGSSSKIEIVTDRPIAPSINHIWNLFGVDDGNNRFCVFESTSRDDKKYMALTYGNSVTSALNYNVESSKKQSKIVLEFGILTFDDNTYRTVSPQHNQTFNINLDLTLFARNTSNTIAITTENTKIYYAKIWNNGVIVRDFIPVLGPNNVPCMYDKVTNKLYYNAGTGNFIAGPVITE